MTTPIIVVANRYVKKGEAREFFRSTRTWFPLLGMLIVFEPFLFWFVINMQRTIIEGPGAEHLKLPFVIEYSFLIACSLALLTVLLNVRFYFSTSLQRKFEENLARHAHLDDDDLIKKSDLLGNCLLWHFLSLALVGLLAIAYLYLSLSSIDELRQVLDEMRPKEF